MSNTNHQSDPSRDEVRALHEQLRQLPQRKAPSTLIPRVMAAIQAKRQVPWYKRTWWTWPLSAKILSGILVVGLGVGTAFLLGPEMGQAFWGGCVSKLQSASDALAAVVSPVGSVVEALGFVLGKVNRAVWVGAAMLGGFLYLSCVGLGTMLYRMSFSR